MRAGEGRGISWEVGWVLSPQGHLPHTGHRNRWVCEKEFTEELRWAGSQNVKCNSSRWDLEWRGRFPAGQASAQPFAWGRSFQEAPSKLFSSLSFETLGDNPNRKEDDGRQWQCNNGDGGIVLIFLPSSVEEGCSISYDIFRLKYKWHFGTLWTRSSPNATFSLRLPAWSDRSLYIL